jgi:hypothetical protein
LPKALFLTILPVPVDLKRLAAPRFVFILGILIPPSLVLPGLKGGASFSQRDISKVSARRINGASVVEAMTLCEAQGIRLKAQAKSIIQLITLYALRL